MNDRKYNVDFDVFEKKLKRFLKVSEERQRDAYKRNNDGRKKHKGLSVPRKEDV